MPYTLTIAQRSLTLVVSAFLLVTTPAIQAGVIVENGTSSLFSVGKTGKLTYTTHPQNGRLPDFSYAGYHSAEKALPDVRVAVTLEPQEGDDTERIQKALDQLGTLSPDELGHRGALLLTKGTYRVAGSLIIRHSGVVLRGEGNGKGGTLIIATGYGARRYKRTLISINNSGRLTVDETSRRTITDEQVGVGSHTLTVESTEGYAVGDRIVVFRPSTKEWISRIGCDKLISEWRGVTESRWQEDGNKPGFYYYRRESSRENYYRKRDDESWEEFQKRVPLKDNGKKIDVTGHWQPGEYDMYLERTIVGIEGTRITINAPVVHSLQKRYGGGAIFHYSTPKRITEVGIEYLRIFSEFGEPTNDYPYGKPKALTKSEQHAWDGIKIGRNTENTWVRNVTGSYFVWSLVSASGVKATVQDCVNLGHASHITGGRRYSFMINGQLNLVQRCSTRQGRHEFVNQARTFGPNVFVDCIGYDSKSSAGPHHRYAVGNLYDNVTSTHYMESRFRGGMGSGHGWAGTQTCFYNCRAPRFIVEAPPGGVSWVLGCGTSREKGKRMTPPSLYYQQVKDRLGEEGLRRLVSEEQLRGIGTYRWSKE